MKDTMLTPRGIFALRRWRTRDAPLRSRLRVELSLVFPGREKIRQER